MTRLAATLMFLLHFLHVVCIFVFASVCCGKAYLLPLLFEAGLKEFRERDRSWRNLILRVCFDYGGRGTVGLGAVEDEWLLGGHWEDCLVCGFKNWRVRRGGDMFL